MRDGSFNCTSSRDYLESLLREGPFLSCLSDRDDFSENLMKIEVKKLDQDVEDD